MLPQIQFIAAENKLNIKKESIFTYSSLGEPNSLDEFDINVIDLSSNLIWQNKRADINSINCANDFANLNTMIRNSKRTKILFLLPQNIQFKYHYVSIAGNSKSYSQSIELKNALSKVCATLSGLMPIQIYDLVYEPTKTKIGNTELAASFHFSTGDGLTKSIRSNKTTTIQRDNIFISTLCVNSCDDLLSLLEEIEIVHNSEIVPEWLSEIYMFDDIQQKRKIDEQMEITRVATIAIEDATKQLAINNRYKSILYTTGDELVDVVFEIMQVILKYDLSDFEDVKKEDFCISLPSCTLIGEIKGVTPNIKSGNITQLDVHFQNYMDKLEEEGKEESVKALLIINHQRTKPLGSREPVNAAQIALAERNGSLIIETVTLLKVLEKCLLGKYSADKISEIFISNVGLLSLQ
jgi:hypothetical protein